MKINLFFVLFLSFLLLPTGRAIAQSLPVLLVPSEVESVKADREIVGESYPGLLLTAREMQNDVDGKYNQPYHAACGVYVTEKAEGNVVRYAQRFLVHAPDVDSLPLAKRVARMLLLLYGANHERMRFDHARTQPTLDVWLSRQAGTGLDANIGGEQFRNQIYIYSIFTERTPAEWVREVAHEYGHYALPGISGFTEPEEWANGVLGERLFLKWLHEDLIANRLKSGDIPFVTMAQFEEYIQKQVSPLIQRVAREGQNSTTLTKRDAAGMEAFVGLALYIDSVYGSKGLLDSFSYTESAKGEVFLHAADFVRGITQGLRSALEMTIAPPLPSSTAKTETFFVFLPRGAWSVTTEGPIKKWEFATEPKGLLLQNQRELQTSRAEWRKITLLRTEPGPIPIRLHLKRRGSELN